LSKFQSKLNYLHELFKIQTCFYFESIISVIFPNLKATITVVTVICYKKLNVNCESKSICQKGKVPVLGCCFWTIQRRSNFGDKICVFWHLFI